VIAAHALAVWANKPTARKLLLHALPPLLLLRAVTMPARLPAHRQQKAFHLAMKGF
jgi:hypothetical protein